MFALHSGYVFGKDVCQGKKPFREKREKIAEFLCFEVKRGHMVTHAQASS